MKGHDQRNRDDYYEPSKGIDPGPHPVIDELRRQLQQPAAKAPADWDNMLDELEYEQVVRLIQRQPQTFYPALLITLVEAAYAKNVFQPGGASALAAKAELKCGNAGDGRSLESQLAQRENQVSNLSMLVVRLSRALPRENDLRLKALDYLASQGLTPSVLRESE